MRFLALLLIFGPISAAAQESALEFEVFPVPEDFSNEILRGNWDGSADPFASLDSPGTNPGEFAPFVRLSPDAGLPTGDWRDSLEVVRIERPKWRLPAGTKMLFHPKTNLLFVAAAPETLELLANQILDWEFDASRAVNIRLSVVRVPKSRWDPDSTAQQLLAEPGVVRILRLNLEVIRSGQTALKFSLGDPKSAKQIIAEVTIHHRHEVQILPDPFAPPDPFLAPVPSVVGPKLLRLGIDEFRIRTPVPGSDESLIAEFSDFRLSYSSRIEGAVRFLMDSEDAVFALAIEPILIPSDRQVSEEELNQIRKIWSEIGPEIEVHDAPPEPEPRTSPVARQFDPAAIDEDGFSAAVFPAGLLQFANAPTSNAAVKLPQFRYLFGEGELVDADFSIGSRIESSRVAIVNRKTDQLFLRASPEDLALVHEWGQGLINDPIAGAGLRATWLETGPPGQIHLLEQLNLYSNSGFRAKGEAWGSTPGSSATFEIDPLFAARYEEFDITFSSILKGETARGEPLRLEFHSKATGKLGTPLEFPLIEIGHGPQSRKFGLQIRADRNQVEFPRFHDFKLGPANRQLSQILKRVGETLQAQPPSAANSDEAR